MAGGGWRLPQAVRIAAVIEENYRTKTFVLEGRLEAEPGQFVMLWLPRFDEKPFSLVNCDPLTVMVTAVGPFSRLMHERKVGDRVWVRGPFGQGFVLPPRQSHAILAAGGYGVAPLYWLAQRLGGLCRSVQVIVGARNAEDVLYAGRFRQLAASSGDSGTEYHLHVMTEDGSQGRMGRVTDPLGPLVAAQPQSEIFACGPHGMLAAIETFARLHGVSTQLSWEAYMRCAIGICGACDHGGKVLCMDGPVLRTPHAMAGVE